MPDITQTGPSLTRVKKPLAEREILRARVAVISSVSDRDECLEFLRMLGLIPSEAHMEKVLALLKAKGFPLGRMDSSYEALGVPRRQRHGSVAKWLAHMTVEQVEDVIAKLRKRRNVSERIG